MARATVIAVCADDYGLSMGVSLGILEAFEAGALSATSAMTNCPRWPAMGRELARRGFDADIGLHLNFTLGRPLAEMPGLAPDGAFPSLSTVVRLAMRGGLDADDVRSEIERQLDRFEAVMGRAPDYVDGHQHVHVLPQIRSALLDALEARGLAGRTWLRDPGDRVHRILIRGAFARKALALRTLARGFRREAERRGFALNDGFSGYSAFDPQANYGALFETYLWAPGRRHLIMCHPGHVDDDLRELDPVTEMRERELAFLVSPRFHELLASKGMRLQRPSAAMERRDEAAAEAPAVS